MKLSDKLEQIKIKKISKNALQSPNKISLCKDNKYENIKVDISKKLISASNKDDIELLKQKIKDFLIVMYSKCENFDDTIFMNNIKKTFFDVSKAKKEFDIGTSDLSFSDDCNIFSLHSFACINRHLLHLTSVNGVESNPYSTYNAYKRYLESINDWNTLLLFDESLAAANDWYTQLLYDRYFEKNDEDFDHVISEFILKQIEHILGKDFLEKSYFAGNFKLDLFTLSHYMTRKNFFMLFNCIQELFKLEEEMQMGIHFKKNRMQALLLMISNILFNCIKTKTYTIDGIDNQLQFLNSNECMAKAITISLEKESVTFDLYDEAVINDFYKELKSIHAKIKEIN